MSSTNHQQYDPDEVVISGISGAFPNSENIEEFKTNLFQGNDMFSPVDRLGTETRCGLMKTIDRFDHTFFRLTYEQAKCTSLPGRMQLEKTFEAILDSGYNLEQLKGKNIAVVSSMWDPTSRGDPVWKNFEKHEQFLTQVNKCQFMVPNRISYCFDFRGPSFPVNTACSSSSYALDIAVRYISDGRCEAAIVCASNFCFPDLDCFYDSSILATHQSSPFDAKANGYIKSESVVVVFLQKRRHARRIYARIVDTQISFDGFKKEGIYHPSIEQQKNLYEQFYREINIDPKTVLYVEAHGTGTQVGDVVEGTSIDEFFHKNRNKPLKIGSVKSNMGHGEAAATLCSIVKMIISFESGLIPANVDYKTPNPNIPGLHNGHLEVVTKTTPVEGEYFAVNSFGIGGANGHILLRIHDKDKQSQNRRVSTIPYLVNTSGRTEEAIEAILSDIEKNSTDVEYIRLMHEIFSQDISGHLYRGYVILGNERGNTKSNKSFCDEHRPIWFVFAGMGSQWPTMGKSLMNIPIFAESIKKSHQLLLCKQLDLIEIITNDDPKIFQNILHSFVGIAAIQVALVDTLSALGISPDGTIGHSVGELGCAYADCCLTAEQMILLAYYRGLVSMQNELVHGTMASVGQGYEDIKHIIPAEIDIACHNSPTSCTISGPTEAVQNFMQLLKQKEIFVRPVNTANIAYHSRYISTLGQKLLSKIKPVIPEPKLRSKKWICTSALEKDWSNDRVKYSSAEYYTNNLLNPVYFEEACLHIPANAITIEIAPHGLLNAILKRSLPSTVDNIPLTMKNHENNTEYFLNALGKMYEMGCAMKLHAIYPPVEFPVSRSTPMISPLIKWQHEEQWELGNLSGDIFPSNERNYTVKVNAEKYAFVTDHIIDGKNLYPGFGYLWLVVETVATIQKKKPADIAVIFEKVRFEGAVIIPKKGTEYFHVSIQPKSKPKSFNFAVLEGNIAVATGEIRMLQDVSKDTVVTTTFQSNKLNFNHMPMKKKDFYKELRLRGYHYKEAFKRVEHADCDGMYAEISWDNNFVTFMDAMAQIMLLRLDSRDLLIPTYIGKVIIDAKKHLEILETLDKQEPKFPAYYSHHKNVLSSGSIQIIDLKGNEITRQRDQADPVLEKYQFVPYISEKIMNLDDVIGLFIRIALQNSPTIKMKTYELLDDDYNSNVSTISTAIQHTLSNLPLVEDDINIIVKPHSDTEVQHQDGITISNNELPEDQSSHLIILSNIQNKTEHELESIFRTLKEGGFIITKQSVNDEKLFQSLHLRICSSRAINTSEKMFLLSKETEDISIAKSIEIKNDSFAWLTETQKALFLLQSESNEKLVLYSEKQQSNGILGFFNCLVKEEKGNHLRCFFIIDPNAPDFTLDHPCYKFQFDKNLRQNVYKNGQWGCYTHLPLEPVSDTLVDYAFCALEESGNLSSFRWIEGSLNSTKNNDKALAHVYYSSLNFHDIMLAMKKISDVYLPYYSRLSEGHQGIEFSGKDQRGQRLAGILPHKGIATMVEMCPKLTWKVPNDMTLEDAATIPVVYATVVYAFFFEMNLEKGSVVLIHAGSGGIGQAAIHICQHYHCEIFTTVGSHEKVEFIRKTFPQIPENHIGNSRDTSFEDLIMRQTKGRGVDVVLNSLAEEKLAASLRCVARGGHFLEIGKYDIMRNNSLELGHFLNNISFHSIQLDLLDFDKPNKLLKLQKKMQEMLDQGAVKPLRRTVFNANDVESGFRLMAAGKHIGKVLIKIRDEDQDPNSKPTGMQMKAKPRVLCQKDKSYIIIGGLGGFGMELADWLILRGARNIVLSSRTGLKNGYQFSRIQIWRSYGANIIISTEDVTTEAGVQNFIDNANSSAPVAGIFNLALVLNDDLFLKQTEETFGLPVGPKATATKLLDKLSRVMCPDLEYFVVFSSVASGIGNQSQTNYGYANSVMERICEARKAVGLPALAIQWGAIGEVGVVVDLAENNISIATCGTLQQKVKSCLNTLDTFMKQENPIVSSMVVAEKRCTGTDVINTVANILGIKHINLINKTWTLPELGMDSILGLEVKQVLESELDETFTTEDLQNMTFLALNRLKEEKNDKKNKKVKKNNSSILFLIEEDLMQYPIRLLPFHQNDINDVTDKKKSLIFVFPGIEGISVSMNLLVTNLNMPAWCFQYHHKDALNLSLQELKEYYTNMILEKMQTHDEFNIIGYSLGGLFAIEIANMLEKKGKKGRIWLIETSQLTKYSFVQDDVFIQNETCNSMIRILQPKMSKEKYITHIEEASSWEAKKQLCVSTLPAQLVGPTMYTLIDRVYGLFQKIISYELPSIKVRAQCILIKCAEYAIDPDDSYGISKYFENPIQTYQVKDVDHFTIVSNPQTANIILRSWTS